MISINELLDLDLTPMEFKTACWLLTVEQAGVIHATSAETAAALSCSEPTSRRVLAELVRKGVFVRLRRGAFAVRVNDHERAKTITDDRKGSPVIPPKYVYVDYMAVSHKSLVEPNGSTNSGGFAPVKGEEQQDMGRYDYETEGDDIGGIGLTEERPATRVKSRKEDLKFHRLTPRSEWDMMFVAKEFRHRVLTDRRDLLGGGRIDTRRLNVVLRKWQRDHGLTPQQAADMVDQFFTDPDRVTALGTHDPLGVLLRFMQDTFPTLLASEITDDWLDELDEQVGRFA